MQKIKGKINTKKEKISEILKLIEKLIKKLKEKQI